jgi:uncharacterized protein (TIGR02147 family)
MNSLFTYLDYRKYLNDALSERKRTNPHFSYRFIAQHLNLKSSAFFNLVIKEKKKLPEALVPKIAHLFKLDDNETAYFSILVKFNHCTESVQREELFWKLERLMKKNNAKHLQPEQYRVFTQWYYVAIREFLHIFDFEDDYQRLATSLLPKIKAKEARTAIRILEKTGLIARGDDGFYRPLESQITTGEVWESELIKNLQIQFAEMGKNAIITLPKQKRNISNLTFCASESTMNKITAEFTALRQKIMALVDDDSDADTVYQCNLQLFPIGQKKEAEQ